MTTTTTTTTATLNGALSRFFGHQELEPEDYQLRCEMLDELQKILEPHGKIHPFGSFYLGLAHVDTPIDVYLEDFANEGNRIDVLKSVKAPLENFCNSGKMTESITHNAMSLPILKLVHAMPNRKKIRLEVSSRNLISLQTSKLIKFMMTLDPVVLPLILFMRVWAEYHYFISMKERAFDSYTFTLFVIAFLTQEKVLPSIQQLQELASTTSIPTIMAQGSKDDDILWNVSFCDDKVKVLNFMKDNNIGRQNNVENAAAAVQENIFEPVEILPWILKFLEFVQHASGKTKPILLTSLGLVKTSQDYLDDIELQELEEVKLTHNEAQLKLAGGFSLKHVFFVQDPFDLSHNTTKVTSTYNSKRLRQAAQATLTHLKSKGDKIRLSDFFIDIPNLTVEPQYLNIMKVYKPRVNILKEHILFASKKSTDNPTSLGRDSGARHYGTVTHLGGFSRQTNLTAVTPSNIFSRRISTQPSSSSLLFKWANFVMRRRLPFW